MLALSKAPDFNRSDENVGFEEVRESFIADCTVMDAYLYKIKDAIRCHLTLQVQDKSCKYDRNFLFYEMYVTFANGNQFRDGKVTSDYSNLCRILGTDIAELDQQSAMKKIWVNGNQQEAVVQELPDLVGASNRFWIEAVRCNARREIFPGNWQPTNEEKWKTNIFFVGEHIETEAFMPESYVDEYQPL